MIRRKRREGGWVGGESRLDQSVEGGRIGGLRVGELGATVGSKPVAKRRGRVNK